MSRFLVILVVVQFFFLGCRSGSYMRFAQRDTLNDKMCDKIVKCINNKDADNLYTLFSDSIKNRGLPLRDDIQKLLKYLNVGTAKYEGFASSGESSIESGKCSTFFWSQCILEMEGYRYWMFYTYVVVDDFEPRNVGLTNLKIIKEEDKEKYSCKFDMVPDGIFLPDEAK